MDLGELIYSFVHQTENFEEAHTAILTMVTESPIDFIHSLLQLISTTEDVQMQENAIDLLTVPIKRDSGGFYTMVDTSNIPDEVKGEIKQVLVDLICRGQNACDKAKVVLCFYVQFNSAEREALLRELSSLITPENAENISVCLFETIQILCTSTILHPGDIIQLLIQFLNFFVAVGDSGDELLPAKQKCFINICTTSLRYVYAPEENQEEIFNVLSYVWELTKEVHPIEGLECFKAAIPNEGLLIMQIPDFVEVVLSFLQSDNPDLRMAALKLIGVRSYFTSDGVYRAHNIIADGRESDIISILNDFITSDENIEIPDSKSFTKLCVTQLANLMMNNIEPISESAFQYAMEHVESESEPERYLSIVFISILASFANLIPQEQLNESLPQFLTFALQEESPRIVECGLNILLGSLYKDVIPYDASLVAIIAEHICSENEEISNIAFDALFGVFGRNPGQVSEELRLQSASFIFQYITKETLDDNRRSELLRNLTTLCQKISPENACTIIQPAMDLASQLMSQASEEGVPLSLSSSIGFASSVLVTAGKSENPEVIAAIQSSIESFFQLSVTLVSSDFMPDGLSVLSSIIKMSNPAPTEVLEFANQIVIEHLPVAANKEEFYSLLVVANNLVPYLNNDPEKSDEETLAMIFQCCINYSNSTSKGSDMIEGAFRIIMDTVALIFQKAPEIILSQMHETFEMMYPNGVRFSTSYGSNNLKLIIGCSPNFTEDPLYARVVADTLSHITFRALNPRRKKVNAEAMITLLEAAHNCDPSFTTVLPVMRFIASNFERRIEPFIENKELVERLVELLPEIPQQPQGPQRSR